MNIKVGNRYDDGNRQVIRILIDRREIGYIGEYSYLGIEESDDLTLRGYSEDGRCASPHELDTLVQDHRDPERLEGYISVYGDVHSSPRPAGRIKETTNLYDSVKHAQEAGGMISKVYKAVLTEVIE